MKQLLLLLMTLSACLPHYGQSVLGNRLEKLLADTLLADSEVGLMVYDLTADRPLFDYQADKLYRPASILKVVTAITALEFLGESHPFTTTLYHTGEITPDSTLNGHLYVVGGFDPLICQADMDAFAATVRDAGIRCINGHLIGNVAMKDTLKWGSGWCWDDDMPPLTPLLYERTDSFMAAMHRSLKAIGITSTDSIPLYMGYAPDSVMTQIAYSERSLAQILDRMMKKSDNLHAEAVFYHLAANHEGRAYATAEDGAEMIKKMIRRVGHNPKRYIIADGSGVSLYNYLSPQLLIDLLRYAYHHSSIYAPLRQSLPIAGVDGTLKNRMKKSSAYRKVVAKTGTLTGVVSLAGYVDSASGHTLAFVIINQNTLKPRAIRAWQDKVCTELSRF